VEDPAKDNENIHNLACLRLEECDSRKPWCRELPGDGGEVEWCIADVRSHVDIECGHQWPLGSGGLQSYLEVLGVGRVRSGSRRCLFVEAVAGRDNGIRGRGICVFVLSWRSWSGLANYSLQTMSNCHVS
jgi:hypothetical protein